MHPPYRWGNFTHDFRYVLSRMVVLWKLSTAALILSASFFQSSAFLGGQTGFAGLGDFGQDAIDLLAQPIFREEGVLLSRMLIQGKFVFLLRRVINPKPSSAGPLSQPIPPFYRQPIPKMPAEPIVSKRYRRSNQVDSISHVAFRLIQAPHHIADDQEHSQHPGRYRKDKE